MIETYEQRKRIKNVRWILFWIALMQTVATLVVNAVTSFMSKPQPEMKQLMEYLQLGIIEIAAFIIPIFVYARTGWSNTERSPKQELRMVHFSPLAGVLVVLMAAGGQFVMSILNIPAVLIMQVVGYKESAQVVTSSLNFRDLILGILCVAVLPAFFEEFILRGFVFSVYEKHSTRAAVLFTTVLFALLHGNIQEFLGLLFMGAMLSLVLIRTGSLFAAMLYHFINNTAALLLGYALQSYYSQLLELPMLMIYMFAGAVILFALGLVLFVKVTPKPKIVRAKGDKKLFVRSIFSMPVILCIAIEIAMNILTQSRI